MAQAFKRIVLFGRQRSTDVGVQETLDSLQKLLTDQQLDVYLEAQTAKYFTTSLPLMAVDQMQHQCDLIIVVGGDGSFLNAGRAAAKFDIPVLGINRGRLGFLTDISPNELDAKVSEVLAGNYSEEPRFLLDTEVSNDGQTTQLDSALNDVVLLPGEVPHMIEFEININNQMVCTQRADGLIVTTPTGSTAYALSGGGPILHPKLDAIAIVPMFPHTLSSRPIVIDANSKVEIKISDSNETSPRISCDGQERIKINPGTVINIHKKKESVRLLHPLDYNYYETLRSKLGWEVKH